MSNPLPRIRLPLGKAVVESCIQQPYTWLRLRGDVMAGVVLAALLFMRDIARMTHVVDISRQPKHVPEPVPDTWGVYKISGPLFFAASTHVFAELREECADKHGMVLCFDSVSLLDAGGLEALQEFMQWCRERHKNLLIADIPFQPLRTLVKAGI